MDANPSPQRTTPPRAPRLRFLNPATLEHLAQTIEDCATAIRRGGRVRGLDPLLTLDTLAGLLHEAAARER